MPAIEAGLVPLGGSIVTLCQRFNSAFYQKIITSSWIFNKTVMRLMYS